MGSQGSVRCSHLAERRVGGWCESRLSSSSARTRGVAAQHASLSRWRSPVRIRSGPPVLLPWRRRQAVTSPARRDRPTLASVAVVLIVVAGLVVRLCRRPGSPCGGTLVAAASPPCSRRSSRASAAAPTPTPAHKPCRTGTLAPSCPATAGCRAHRPHRPALVEADCPARARGQLLVRSRLNLACPRIESAQAAAALLDLQVGWPARPAPGTAIATALGTVRGHGPAVREAGPEPRWRRTSRRRRARARPAAAASRQAIRALALDGASLFGNEQRQRRSAEWPLDGARWRCLPYDVGPDPDAAARRRRRRPARPRRSQLQALRVGKGVDYPWDGGTAVDHRPPLLHAASAGPVAGRRAVPAIEGAVREPCSAAPTSPWPTSESAGPGRLHLSPARA